MFVFTLSRGHLFTIQLQSFLLAWRAPWPGWPLAFQVFQFSEVALVLLSVSFYVTEKYPLIVKIDQYENGCHLKTHFWSRQDSFSELCVRVASTFMMHVLTFILQHVNIMIVYSIMMTPYNS